MTLDEYMAAITILIVPEDPECPHPRGGLASEQTFWLHTYGMKQFDRPEMEMRGVPAFYINAAGRFLNTWAYHSIGKSEVKAGENLQDDSGQVPLIFTVEAVEDPWYEKRGIECLRLIPAAILFECDGNHEDDPVH